MKKEEQIKYFSLFLSAGTMLGCILTFIFNNVLLMTIFMGVGSAAGWIYIWLKSKKK